MKTIYFVLLIVTFLSLPFYHPIASAKPNPYVASKETYVYICDSKTAYAYHSTKDCSSLNACTHKIIKLTLNEARHVITEGRARNASEHLLHTQQTNK